MNKINVICELNQQTNQVEIKQLIILKEGEQPRVINYEGFLSLASLEEFANANGTTLIGPEGIKPALASGFLRVATTLDKVAMAEVRAEILAAEIKAEANNQIKRLTAGTTPEKTDVIESVEDVKKLVKTPTSTSPIKTSNAPVATVKPAETVAPVAPVVPEATAKPAAPVAPVAPKATAKPAETVAPTAPEAPAKPGPKVPVIKEVKPEVTKTESSEKSSDAKKEEDFSPSNLAELIKELRKLNPGVQIRMGNPELDSGAEMRFYASKPGNELVLPKKFNYSETDGINNKTDDNKDFVSYDVRDISKVRSDILLPEDKEPVEKVKVEKKEEVKVTKVIDLGTDKRANPPKEGPESEINKARVLPEEVAAELAADDVEIPKEVIDKLEEETNTRNIKPRGRLRNFFRRAGAWALTVISAAAVAIVGHEHLGKFGWLKNKQPVTPDLTTPTITQDATVTPNQVATPTARPTTKPTVVPTAQPTARPTTKPTVQPTVQPTETSLNHQRVLQNFINKYNVPQNTVIFLNNPQVLNFISRYQNEAQLSEVLTALAYGYESNALMTKEGNFRLGEDGQNILYSFTRDFMSAKALVNNYDSQRLMTLFGGKDITYEMLISGFHNYCYTTMTYGLNATERLPFHYLTNNDAASTRAMNELFDLLTEVNRNRENGTLTSKHTDDFIAKTFKIFVEDGQSIHLSEASKTVLATMVDSFAMMQSNVAGGKALYLHEDRGSAKAGINLAEVNGKFAINYKDKTTYEFTSLFDVMNHKYADSNERCVLEQERMINNILAMGNDTTSASRDARSRLASALHKNGLGIYADKVLDNNIDEDLLLKIQKANPMMFDDVAAYRNSVNSFKNNLIGFRETYTGIDNLLRVPVIENNYSDLINVRRARALNAKYNFKGKSQSTGGTQTTTTTTTQPQVTTTTEQVQYEDLTLIEQLQVEQQQAQLEQQEAIQHQEQAAQIEEAVQDLREGVQSGATQSELEQIAAESGITLDPNYQANMAEVLRQQQEAEAERLRIEREVAERNAQAEREAAERRRQEEAEQQRRLEEEQALINESIAPEVEVEVQPSTPAPTPVEESTTPVPTIDPQLDPNFSTEDEEVYDPNASVKETLNSLKAMALSAPVELERGLIKTKTPRTNRSA